MRLINRLSQLTQGCNKANLFAGRQESKVKMQNKVKLFLLLHLNFSFNKWQ